VIGAKVRAALATVNDPEYPLSIVDLGMIYGVEVVAGVARITLTFTSIGCPAADMLIDDIRAAVFAVDEIEDVQVDVVWSPPWNAERISARGKQVLAMYGVAV
jgi:metal-sulfur cluster biosynthetic enzyme